MSFSKDSILLGYSQDFETIGQLANALTDQITYGLPDDDYVTYPDKIAAVNVTEANRVAKSYFDPAHCAVIVVGDLSKIEDPVRALDLGPIHLCDREGNLLQPAVESDTELSSE